MKKHIKIFLIIGIMIIFFTNIFATNQIIEETSDTLKLDSMLNELNNYVERSELDLELNLRDLAKNLVTGKNTNYSNLVNKLLDIFAGETLNATKNTISILIIVVVMGIFSSLEIDKNSSISKIVYLVSFIIIVTILTDIYSNIIQDYTKTIRVLSGVMQTVTPFVMVVMVASGGIVSSNLIQPIILFIASLVGFLINYIVIPFVTVALIMKIVSMLSENVRLNKFGEVFSKSSLWITAVIFTMFLSVISVKGSITTSVDSAVVKTTQTAVSNFIPVVGKFVSDSLESIMGATEVIGKTAGIIGIVVMTVVSLLPILQMLIIFISHKILSALSETIIDNKNIIGIIDSFSETYKVLLGVLIGVLALFIMSSGILIKLIGNIT